jgi:hypothetical protein
MILTATVCTSGVTRKSGVVGPSPNKFLTHSGSTFFIKKTREL